MFPKLPRLVPAGTLNKSVPKSNLVIVLSLILLLISDATTAQKRMTQNAGAAVAIGSADPLIHLDGVPTARADVGAHALRVQLPSV